jgi:hypothetical protein
VNRTTASQIAKLCLGAHGAGYSIEPVRKEEIRQFDFYAKDSVGAFRVSDGQATMLLLFVDWRDGGNYYVVAADLRGSGTIVSAHRAGCCRAGISVPAAHVDAASRWSRRIDVANIGVAGGGVGALCRRGAGRRQRQLQRHRRGGGASAEASARASAEASSSASATTESRGDYLTGSARSGRGTSEPYVLAPQGHDAGTHSGVRTMPVSST